MYSIYQRTVLFLAAVFSLVNLNHVLCKSEADPFARWYDSWYYLFAELYLNLTSYLVKMAILVVAGLIGDLAQLYGVYQLSKGYKKARISQSQFKKML